MSRRGFTLVEALIAIAVSSIVVVGAYELLSFSTRTAKRAGDASQAVDAVGGAFVQIAERLRFAEQVTEPGSGGESARLEFSNVKTGAWNVSLVDGDVVLQESHGLDRKVVGRGIDALKFSRRDLEEHVVRLEMRIGEGPKARVYTTALFARGTRRPPWR